MGYPPVVVVDSGGVPRTQVAEGVSAPAFTVVESGARPITLTTNAPPIALFNPDGTPYTGGGYSAEAVDLFERMVAAGASEPSVRRKQVIDSAIRSLKSDPSSVGSTIWSRLELLEVRMAHDELAVYVDWTGKHTPAKTGVITWTVDDNIQGNGSTGKVAVADIIFNEGGRAYSQNSISFGFWSDTNTSASVFDFGAENVSLAAQNGNQFTFRAQAAASDSISNGGDGTGLIVVSRVDAANEHVYRNGALVSTVARASAAPPASTALWSYGRSFTSSFSARKCKLAFVGAGFTALEVQTIYDVFNRYRLDLPSALGVTSDLMHGLLYGQSLSIGGSSGTAISSTQLAGAKRFVGGVRPQNTSGTADGNDSDFASLVALYEDSGVETPAYGCAQMVKQLLAADGVTLGSSQSLLMSTAGEGSQGAAALAPGTSYFDRLKNHITKGNDRKTTAYALSALLMAHGEADTLGGTAAATYKTHLRNMREQAQAHAYTTTGVNRQTPMILYQVAVHRRYAVNPVIAMAQTDLAAEYLFGLATPIYHMPYIDGLHLTPEGYKWLGAYFGIALKRWLWNGTTPQWLKPGVATRAGTKVTIPFTVPSGALAFDTTQVAAQTNYGFELLDSGDTPMTITNVAIVGNTVEITASATVGAGAKVHYAWQGDADKGLGNLRDSQGDTLVFDPTGINKRMDNFCPIFERIAA